MGDLLCHSRIEHQPPLRTSGESFLHSTPPRPQRAVSRVGISGGSADLGFLPGTLVLIRDGEIPIEFLNPGDMVVTRRGLRRLKAVMHHRRHAGSRP